MPLTVKWDEGVSVEFGGTKLVFDPQRNNHLSSDVFVTHAHFDHAQAFSFRETQKVSTEETAKIVRVYGREVDNWMPIQLEERVKTDDLEVVSHNAGHVLVSALYEVITPEGNIVYT